VWEGSVERSCEPMNKNRVKGAADQDERAKSARELPRPYDVYPESLEQSGVCREISTPWLGAPGW
jgi:hypothetical protein